MSPSKCHDFDTCSIFIFPQKRKYGMILLGLRIKEV